MLFKTLVEYIEQLEATTKRLEMTDIVAELFNESGDDLKFTVLFTQGKLFPAWDSREVGIADKMMMKCLSTASGTTVKKIEESIAKTGDPGITAEKIFQHKSQTSLATRDLEISGIASLAVKLAELKGAGSQDKKVKNIVDLLNSATPQEAKYLTRLLLTNMRLGVGEGIVRDGIAKAFDIPSEVVETAYSRINDFSEVAEIARDKGEKGLKKVKLKLGRPLRPMLGPTAGSIESILETFSPAVFQYKYDGMRIQIHVKKGKVQLFTRRLDEVTTQFPDIVEYVKKAVKADNTIFEGEAVAIDKKGKPVPFQILSRRIKRKHDIEEIAEKIPVILYLFDIMMLDGKEVLDKPYKERWKLLKKMVKPVKGKLYLADNLVTADIKKATKFYKQALVEQEGVMIKNPEKEYKPRSRVGYMYKLKPATETLDLVIVGADWGEGRRAKWLGSYHVACRDPDTGELLGIGKIGTGLTDVMLDQLTETLRPTITEQDGKFVKLRPTLVVEVGYQELQRSQTYASGYALRFPKLVRLRDDRDVDECDTLERVMDLMG